MKSYTDIEQSKKLAKILPIESADMHWQYIEEDNGQLQWFCFSKDFSINQYDKVPAWSISAFLEIIRNNGRYELQMYEGGYYFEANGFITESYFNPVDACYEMILRLHKCEML